MTRLVAILVCLGACATAAEPDLPPIARVNLERNLRWMLARERARPAKPPKARVGVWADAGVWHEGARSVVAALEADGVACRVIDRTTMTADGLAGLEAVILPGGWAPHQIDAAGAKGLAALKTYVRGGGRCVGICAGAYLLAETVRYEGTDYPYPLGLFDGVARGPVAGLSPYPKPGSARLTPTDAGKARGLAAATQYYSGGPCFEKGTGVVTLATYADGSAAVVSRKVGKGEVVLTGAHPERPPAPAGDDAPPPKVAGKILKALAGVE